MRDSGRVARIRHGTHRGHVPRWLQPGRQGGSPGTAVRAPDHQLALLRPVPRQRAVPHDLDLERQHLAPRVYRIHSLATGIAKVTDGARQQR